MRVLGADRRAPAVKDEEAPTRTSMVAKEIRSVVVWPPRVLVRQKSYSSISQISQSGSYAYWWTHARMSGACQALTHAYQLMRCGLQGWCAFSSPSARGGESRGLKYDKGCKALHRFVQLGVKKDALHKLCRGGSVVDRVAAVDALPLDERANHPRRLEQDGGVTVVREDD